MRTAVVFVLAVLTAACRGLPAGSSWERPNTQCPDDYFKDLIGDCTPCTDTCSAYMDQYKEANCKRLCPGMYERLKEIPAVSKSFPSTTQSTTKESGTIWWVTVVTVLVVIVLVVLCLIILSYQKCKKSDPRRRKTFFARFRKRGRETSSNEARPTTVAVEEQNQDCSASMLVSGRSLAFSRLTQTGSSYPTS